MPNPVPKRGSYDKTARPSLDKPPTSAAAASAEDQAYIDGEKLRRRLIEANP
jgi:hypothetical protein